jgi:hypothetical protein
MSELLYTLSPTLASIYSPPRYLHLRLLLHGQTARSASLSVARVYWNFFTRQQLQYSVSQLSTTNSLSVGLQYWKTFRA